jgi:hypothetical protein
MKRKDITFENFEQLFRALVMDKQVDVPARKDDPYGFYYNASSQLIEMQFVAFLRTHMGLPEFPMRPNIQSELVKYSEEDIELLKEAKKRGLVKKSRYEIQCEAYEKEYSKMLTKSNLIAFVRQQKKDAKAYQDEMIQSWNSAETEPPSAEKKKKPKASKRKKT